MQAKVECGHAKAGKVAAAVRCWGGSVLRRAFVTWRERHASWQQGHAKVARAAALWHNRALAGAWQQWKDAAVYQQELRLRLTGAIGTFHRATSHFTLLHYSRPQYYLELSQRLCVASYYSMF